MTQRVRSPLAEALRAARRATGLTQGELGQRIGLDGQAVYRWERDENMPTPLHQRRVWEVIGSLHVEAAVALEAVMVQETKQALLTAVPTSESPRIPSDLAGGLVEQGLFSMADELDISPRRLRSALQRWLGQLREKNLTLEVVQREIARRSGVEAGGSDREPNRV